MTDHCNETGPLTIAFDPAKYAEFLDEFDLTKDQKTELLWTMWGIVVQFVDVGFRVSPLQFVIEKPADSETAGPVKEGVLASKHSLNKQIFEDVRLLAVSAAAGSDS